MLQRNQLFHNEGRGKRFRETSRLGGAAFQAGGSQPRSRIRRYRQ